MVTSVLRSRATVDLTQCISDFNRLDVPDLFGILVDGSVAAELAGTQSIQDGYAVPLGSVHVCFVHFFLGLDVSLEI